jgi:hypothetical protein
MAAKCFPQRLNFVCVFATPHCAFDCEPAVLQKLEADVGPKVSRDTSDKDNRFILHLI